MASLFLCVCLFCRFSSWPKGDFRPTQLPIFSASKLNQLETRVHPYSFHFSLFSGHKKMLLPGKEYANPIDSFVFGVARSVVHVQNARFMIKLWPFDCKIYCIKCSAKLMRTFGYHNRQIFTIPDAFWGCFVCECCSMHWHTNAYKQYKHVRTLVECQPL